MESLIGEKAAHKLRKETVANRKEAALFCDTCFRPQDDAKEQFQLCGRCKSVERITRYCSKCVNIHTEQRRCR